jgi:hypothetical protein
MAANKVDGLRLSSTPLDTPRHTLLVGSALWFEMCRKRDSIWIAFLGPRQTQPLYALRATMPRQGIITTYKVTLYSISLI